MANRNRDKGHDLERLLARMWREWGFKHCKTTREASKMLDNCGIDLVNIPFVIQAKSGYEKNFPKYEVEYKNIKVNLKKEGLEESEFYHKPIILIHKRDGGGPTRPWLFTWTLDHYTMSNLLAEFYSMQEELKKLKNE